MSTVISCSLLSGRPAAAPSRSSGNRVPPTGKAAAVALSCFQRQSRPSSVCLAIASNPKGDQHVPKTDLPPFSISPVALLHPGSPQGERWQIKEKADAVSMWFEVPGLSKEDLVVELDEDVLVIRMKDKVETAAATTDVVGSASSKDAAGAAAHDGSMYARLLVPAGYNKETVKAELASGVLKVTIDKVKERARRRINVDIHVK